MVIFSSQIMVLLECLDGGLTTTKLFDKNMYFSEILCCFLTSCILIFWKSKTCAFKKYRLSKSIQKHLSNRHCLYFQTFKNMKTKSLAIEGKHRAYLLKFLHFRDKGMEGTSSLLVTVRPEVGLQVLVLGFHHVHSTLNIVKTYLLKHSIFISWKQKLIVSR